ncbi:MAG: SBBP repeat-containing protein [Lewinellaceae bacterium]|nr:SBBP repeat-containing protein [Lewinellaceae bacterium]
MMFLVIMWVRQIAGPGDDYTPGIAVDGSGNVFFTGHFYGTADFDPGAGTANLSSAGFSDIFLAKFDAAGNYTWAKRVGGPDFEGSNDIAVDGSGNVHITGYFQGNNVDFDPAAGVANLSSTGYSDIFIAKYDASGNYIWAKQAGGTGFESGNGIALDGSGNVHITGNFPGVVDFDPGGWHGEPEQCRR